MKKQSGFCQGGAKAVPGLVVPRRDSRGSRKIAMGQASALTAKPQNIRTVDSSFMLKVFYAFAALALLSLGISVGGKWFGRSIALAGHTDDATLREIVIGNNVISAPANMIRFERARRDGVAQRLDLYLRWPDLDGYSDAARADFNHANNARRIIFVSFEQRMMSRDMSGRLQPIYASMVVRPAVAGPAGIALYELFGTVRLSERGPGGRRPAWRGAVRRPLPQRDQCGRIARALRARYPYRRQSEPVLPLP